MQLCVDLRFVLEVWMNRYGRIYVLDSLILVLFDCVEVYLELVVVLVNYLFLRRKVNHKCNRYVVENISMTSFTGLLHLLKNLVFLCQTLMEFEVVDKIFLSVLSQKIELYIAGVRRPLEIKK